MVIFTVSMLTFFVSLGLMFTMKSHVLMLLMLLEFSSISVMVMLINFFNIYIFDIVCFIYMTIVMVSEAVMGLVLITLLVRTHGNDYLKTSCIFLC